MHHSTDNPVFAIVVAAVLLIMIGCSVERAHAQVVDSTLAMRYDTTTQRTLPGPVEVWRVGAYVLFGRTLHTAAQISGLPGVPNCCDGFFNGSGSTWEIGLLAELPVAGTLRAGWRLGVSSYDGQLSRIINEEVHANRSLVVATFEHSVSASHFGIDMEPYLSYSPLKNLGLRLGVGGEFMLSTSFSQVEHLVEPEGITYENGRRTRLEFSGPVEEANQLFVTLRSGIRYDLSLNRDNTWMVAPEIVGWYGLSDMLDETPWKMHGIRIGASLQRVAWKIPQLPGEDLEVIFPIRSEPIESLGTELDEEMESGPDAEEEGEE